MDVLSTAVAKAAWDESKHPRVPAGTDAGGEFRHAVPRSLEEVRHRATRYEVIGVSPTGERIRVGFTGRKNGIGLIKALQTRGPSLVTHLGVLESDTFHLTKGRSPVATLKGWTFSFSGLTERDVAGHLHWTGKLPSPGGG
jgi:hypothetical protein